MLFHYGRVFEINDLAVAPDFQGRGIATALLEKDGYLHMVFLIMPRFMPRFVELVSIS